MKKISILALVLGFGLLFFNSCQKDETDNSDLNELITSEDLLTVQDLVEDTEDEVENAVNFRGGESGDCPVITVVPGDNSFPRTVTIDYGTEGCEGPSGRIRKGILEVTLSASLSTPGAERRVSYIDFSIDEVEISGSRILRNESVSPEGNSTFTHQVDVLATFPDGRTAAWKANHTRKQLSGGNTATLLDDVFSISGSSEGINREGKSFSSNILQSLARRRSCRWFEAGILEINRNDKTWTLNFGDGGCDAIAVVTLPDGNTRRITIRNWWR